MHITILTSTYPRFSGDSTAPFIQSIAEGLTELGHEITVIAPDDVLVSNEQHEKRTVRRFRYFWPRRAQIMGHARALQADTRLHLAAYLLLPFFLLAQLLTLLKVTRQETNDLIYAHWVLPNGPAAALVARLRQIPLAISLHGSDMYLARKNRCFGAAARACFRQAQYVTACSPELKRAAQILGAPPETRLLPWGVDPHRFHPGAATTSPRLSAQSPPAGKLVVALGRMVPKKGFDVLLQAWGEIAPQFPTARLIIGGAGAQFAELVRMARQLDLEEQVIFAGEIPWEQTPIFLARADIFVLPSRRDAHGNQDGLPTVLLEALSCGLPVIASHIGGVNLVIEDAINGLLVTPADSTALAEQISRLLTDASLRARLGQAARQKVLREHTWAHVAQALTADFKQLVGTTPVSTGKS